MNQKTLLIIVGVIIILGIIVLGIRFLSGPEDNWICVNGEWIKHGQPESSMPTTPCPGANINNSDQIENQNYSNVVEELRPYAGLLQKELADWFMAVTSTKEFNLSDFKKIREEDFKPELIKLTYPVYLNLETDAKKYLSPDKSRYVLIYHDQPDTGVDLCLKGDEGVNLFWCGTSCGFNKVIWLDDEKFVIDGMYWDNDDNVVPQLWFYNLTNNKNYYFEKQAIITNPIVVAKPIAYTDISSPIEIEGKAVGNWYFEASFPITLLNASGKEIASTVAQAQSDWMTTEYVPFKANLQFKIDKDQEGKLIFMNDNPSGSPENQKQVEFSVNLKVEQMTIKVFFGNEQKNPGAMDCSIVFPVERKIIKTTATAKAAIEELLKGPNEEEHNTGYFTSINSGVALQKITIKDSTAYADFDEQLEFQVGGSCRVAAINSQIVTTLKQFSSIKNVVISINGRTEDILQP